MRKIIIFGLVFLLFMTSVNAYSITEELSDNEFLNLGNDINLEVSYENYVVNDEEIIFYFEMDDYNRDDGNNFRIRKRFEAMLETEMLVTCLEENDNDYCYDNYINGDSIVVVDEDEVIPVKMQLTEEVTSIRNKVER